MKDSEVYLRAAEIMDSAYHGFASCSAICNSISGTRGNNDWREVDRTRGSALGRAFVYLFDGITDEPWESKQARVLALLFMHQIALDEERK